MDIGKSFTYVFEDRKWFEKVLIGAVVAIVPIVSLALPGYANEIIRRVTGESTEPLPDWGDFGQKFVEGLLLAVAGFVYGLPALIFGLPLIPVIIGAANQADARQQGVAWMLGGLGVVLACLLVIYGLVFSFVFPAVQINYARKRQFAAAFYLKEIFRLVGDNLGNYVVAWLAYVGAALVVGLIVGFASALLGWIPCIGWILSMFVGAVVAPLVLMIYGHLFGQIGSGTALVVEVPKAS